MQHMGKVIGVHTLLLCKKTCNSHLTHFHLFSFFSFEKLDPLLLRNPFKRVYQKPKLLILVAFWRCDVVSNYNNMKSIVVYTFTVSDRTYHLRGSAWGVEMIETMPFCQISMVITCNRHNTLVFPPGQKHSIIALIQCVPGCVLHKYTHSCIDVHILWCDNVQPLWF